jgi:hypothetical protein
MAATPALVWYSGGGAAPSTCPRMAAKAATPPAAFLLGERVIAASAAWRPWPSQICLISASRQVKGRGAPALALEGGVGFTAAGSRGVALGQGRARAAATRSNTGAASWGAALTALTATSASTGASLTALTGPAAAASNDAPG